jgi:hypothetical protein
LAEISKLPVPPRPTSHALRRFQGTAG